jgi:hypothetical protein
MRWGTPDHCRDQKGEHHGKARAGADLQDQLERQQRTMPKATGRRREEIDLTKVRSTQANSGL